MMITCRPNNRLNVLPPGRCNRHGGQATDHATLGCHQHQLCSSWLCHHRRPLIPDEKSHNRTSHSSWPFILKIYAGNRRISPAVTTMMKSPNQRQVLALLRNFSHLQKASDHWVLRTRFSHLEFFAF